MYHKRPWLMPGRNHGINANIEILVIPTNLSVGNGYIPPLILWQQSIKIGLIPNGIPFQMFKVSHMYTPRGYAFFMYPAWGGGSTFVTAATFPQDVDIIANPARNLLASKKFVKSPQVLRPHDLPRFIGSLTGNGYDASSPCTA